MGDASPSSKQLSAVIITLNAASQLEDCLKSLTFVNEIIVVDSGSSDETLAVAQRYGAKVVSQNWLGYGKQKQFAVAQAQHDWVLCVDADERVSEELKHSILKVLNGPSDKAYQMPRCNRFMGRYLRHGEGYPDWNLRLFHRQYARWSDDTVHEHVITEHPVGRLAGDLLHDSAESLERYLDKQNRYTTLAAQRLFESGKKAGFLHLSLSPLARFIKFYFLRLGFLDGAPGLIHTSIGCMNSFMKYAKLRELQKRNI